jgi:hypothetical protein
MYVPYMSGSHGVDIYRTVAAIRNPGLAAQRGNWSPLTNEGSCSIDPLVGFASFWFIAVVSYH